MPTNWEVVTLTRRYAALQREISRVAEKNHEKSRGRFLLRSLEKLIELQARKLTKTLERIPRENDADRQVRYEAAAIQLAAIVELFEKCDRLDSARVPFELLDALGQAASEILGEPCEIVVHLASAYNYEIVSLGRLFDLEGWAWMAPLTFKPRCESDPTLLLMVFPSYEVASASLHAAAAHELGHELAYKHKDAITASLDTHRSEIVKSFVLEGHVERTEGGHKFPLTGDDFPLGVDTFGETVNRIVKNWTEELLGDLLGTHLIGPAFLLALERISVGISDYDAIDEEHPPLRLRRSLMKKYLDSHMPHIASDPVWHRYLMDEPRSRRRQGAAWSAATKICERMFQTLTDVVRNVESPLSDAVDVSKHLSIVEAYLDELIPPSLAFNFSAGRIGSAFWFLLYASWHFISNERRFAAFCERYNWTPGGETARRAVDSLLLQSLQSVELRSRKWLKSRPGACSGT